MSQRCVLLLGGSFDPVHQGHVALAHRFMTWLAPAELRIIPAGNPWQKGQLHASPAQRIALLELAFDAQKNGINIDQQEIHRHTASYSIDTLRAIRAELGLETSIVFLMGADQLQNFHTWHAWRTLFDYAHICAASRPGFALEAGQLDPAVAHEFLRRQGSAKQIRETPWGLTCIKSDVVVDIAATDIRARLRQSGNDQNQAKLATDLSPQVLDYIQQHHLYQS